MVKCQICSRQFKSEQALGGHISHAHRQTKEQAVKEVGGVVEGQLKKPKESAQTQPQLPAPASSSAISTHEPSEAEQIRFYCRQGIDFEQLTTKLGFKPSTVRQEIAKLLLEEKAAAEKSGAKPQLLPIVLKDGKGEMIAPEAVYYQLVANDGISGEMDFRALMKWAAAIEMVQRMTQIRKGEAEAFADTIKPMLDMMDKSRQELDAAAQRARESNMEIAEAAAMGAAGGVLGRIAAKIAEFKQQKADIATVQDPMKGLMARTMETMISRLTGTAFGGEVPPTPGLIDKRLKQ